MTDTFNLSLSRDRLSEQVADQIQDLVVKDSLRPGEKLPSERDLANRLGISRTVIREAARTLAVRGLVEVRHGSGTYIRQPTPQSVSAPISLLLKLQQSADEFEMLCEVRLTLEVAMAGLAADRATEDDIAEMEAAIRAMSAHIDNAEQFVKYDLDFHLAVAGATQNDLYLVLLTPITDLLLDFRLTAYRYDAEESVTEGLSFHRRITERIKARDAQGARLAMQEHLEQAQDLFDAARKHTGVV